MEKCLSYHPMSKSQFRQKVDIARLCCQQLRRELDELNFELWSFHSIFFVPKQSCQAVIHRLWSHDQRRDRNAIIIIIIIIIIQNVM